MSVETRVLNVEGMSCMHCVNAVKQSLVVLQGVKSVDVDLAGKKVAVEYDQAMLGLDAIKDAIDEAGYQVV